VRRRDFGACLRRRARLANQANFILGERSVMTDINFEIKEGSVSLIDTKPNSPLKNKHGESPHSLNAKRQASFAV
jgi:hypothetical protein